MPQLLQQLCYPPEPAAANQGASCAGATTCRAPLSASQPFLQTAVNTYSHWGGNGTVYDPDGTPEVTANCAVGVPTTFYKLYHYYTGAAKKWHALAEL
jgi:hypothetical protein